MKKMLNTMVLVSTVLVLQACAMKTPQPLMSELQGADYPVTYINDGAGDESVLNTLHYSGGQNRECRKTLAKMIALREEAIPLLIEHLDDMSPTQAKYQQAEGLAVPFGFVCLDILMQITDSPATIRDCKEEGMGACIHRPYYYLPDVSAKKAALVKEKWQALYRKGEIRYIYPEWWKKRS
jgi:hypothetical protein